MTKFTILDGGMGGELKARGLMNGAGLWSAQVLRDEPEAVASVHRDFIMAGAQVIITNSYSTIPSYMAKAGLENEYLEYTVKAGHIARRVADEFPTGVLVAGSLPPLDESYRFDLVPEDEVAGPIYQSIVEALNPYVDLFICETMSCAREARNAATQASLHGLGKPVWVSWSLHEKPGEGLRSGESVEDAFAAVCDIEPSAYLFNCSTPESITSALQKLRMLTDKPVGVYPNLLQIPAGWTLDNELQAGQREMEIEDFLMFAREWRALGASIIGGCCGIGPKYIEALAQTVEA